MTRVPKNLVANGWALQRFVRLQVRLDGYIRLSGMPKKKGTSVEVFGSCRAKRNAQASGTKVYEAE